MSLTWRKTADVNTSSKIKAAMLARKPSSAAAANATNAAQNAALAAQNAAALAAAAATNAAQSAGGTAQMAAAGLNKGVKQGVRNARSWAAPRLDSAAARYRYRAAIAADSEVADEEMPADPAGSLDGNRPASEKAREQDTEASVNGQVTASGR